MDVSDKALRRQVVLVAELVGRTKAGPDKLEGYIFNDCEIIGPAVLLPVDDTHFNDCSFEAPEVFMVAEPDRHYFGVVSVYNCTFENCRFERVGILGHPDLVEQTRKMGS